MSLTRAWAAWAAWWEGRVPSERYAPLRVGLGLVLLVQWLTLWPVAGLQFDARGLGAAVVGGAWGHVRWTVLDGLTGAQVPALLGVGVALALAFTAGRATRAAGAALFALDVLLLHRSNDWQDGSDCLARCLLFFLCFATPRGGSAVWPLRMVRIQIATVYLATAIWKLRGHDWHDGTALYWALQDPRYQRFSLDAALATATGQRIAALATWSTLGIELALPALLLVPRSRRIGLALGTSLHLGIWLTMRIGMFSPLMLVSYLAFVERDAAGRWLVSND